MTYSKRTVQVNTFFNEWFLLGLLRRIPEGFLRHYEAAKQLLELGTRINPGNQATNKLIDADEENTKNEAVKTIAFNQEELNKIEDLEIKEVKKLNKLTQKHLRNHSITNLSF